jgi:hypothetical protein
MDNLIGPIDFLSCSRHARNSWAGDAFVRGEVERGQLGPLRLEVVGSGISASVDVDDGDAQIGFGLERDFAAQMLEF